MAVDSAFMRIPPEIRMVIYEHLLDNGSKTIAIRNIPNPVPALRKANAQTGDVPKRRRTCYHVLEKTLMRRSYQTTYYHEGAEELHPAIMAVNKKIREEASHLLYGRHSFHFGADLEAVAPFLGDRTASTRELLQAITIHKRASSYGMEADAYDWAAACRVLKTMPRLRRLTIVVGGGRPRRDWEGPRELSVSDLRLLYSTRHESLDWLRELAGVKSVREIEIVADVQYMPEPKTTPALIFAAFSASIETSLVDFMKTELGVPARVGRLGSDGDDSVSFIDRSRGGCQVS